MLALALAVVFCEEIEKSMEQSEEVENEEDKKKIEMKAIEDRINEMMKVVPVFSEKAIKNYFKKVKKIKVEEVVTEESHNEAETTTNVKDFKKITSQS